MAENTWCHFLIVGRDGVAQVSKPRIICRACLRRDAAAGASCREARASTALAGAAACPVPVGPVPVCHRATRSVYAADVGVAAAPGGPSQRRVRMMLPTSP
jgi:hypothetical protein